MSGKYPDPGPAKLPDKSGHRFLRRRAGLPLFSLVAILIVTLSSLASASAGPRAQGQGSLLEFQGEHRHQEDRDNRRGSRAPDARQRSLIAQNGAQVRWNVFGTPAALRADSGFLTTGLPGDEVAAARTWALQNRELLHLSAQGVADLELIYSVPLGKGRAVMFRQRFGTLPAGHDGLLALAVVEGKIAYVSSSIAGDGDVPGAPTVPAATALQTAAADVGRTVRGDQVREGAAIGEARELAVAGFSHPARARLVAVPTPQNGVRPAWEITLIDNAAEPLAFTSYVDAQTNIVLLREDLVDYLDPDDPSWSVFPNSPPLDFSSSDTRNLWCWFGSILGCDHILADSATAPVAWDINAVTNEPTFTTNGNNAIAVHNWFSNAAATVGTETATPRPDRNYSYPWTNQWYEQRCNPDTTFTSPERNDIDAARANLFAMHNQMHDWSYHLGFTEATFNLQRFNFGRGGAENDPEQGNAQAGGVSGGAASGFAARDNANQITGADGQAPITNMYLWQPIAGGFYSPCVDGDYDMSVIGHEYTHAISNRMVAGPNSGLTGSNSRAMGESWSDLAAMEILNEFGFAPLADENRYAVGPYATGDKQAGIRNYGMNANLLNFSDVGYDFVCNGATCPLLTQVHADGEIWSAVNFQIRQAMNARYDGAYPSSDAALQLACAQGQTPVDQCPGNRRWIQLMFDAWLLMGTSVPTMLDARDAMLASDLTRFGGANQDLLWNVFASRGFGQGASMASSEDANPVPSFQSAYASEATLLFTPMDDDGNPIQNANLFVGHYEARVTPVADTNPATALGNQVLLVPGTYEFLIQAPGYGHQRVTLTLRANQIRNLAGRLPANLASSTRGATASGDGINQGALIDDTEATNWASLASPVAGKRVTVRLDPSKPFHQIRHVQVSAMLRHRIPTDPGGDTAAQNRFTALRQFEIWTCQAQDNVDCSQDSQFQKIYTSPADAFPSVAPRPRAPDMTIRLFDIPRTRATHVQLRVLHNQCTGGPDYQGDQDDDPLNITDCEDGSTQDDNVRVAELQVFSQ